VNYEFLSFMYSEKAVAWRKVLVIRSCGSFFLSAN